MKYLKLFENFEDYLDPSTRDIFGLREEIEIEGSDFSLVGPTENLHVARAIADKLMADLMNAYEDAYDYHIERGKGEEIAEIEAYSASHDVSNEFLEDEKMKAKLEEIGYFIKKDLD
jgi:rRNA processing protein Krr1/Pno1